MICKNCKNKEICKYEENMRKLIEEIKEKIKMAENSEFTVEIKCKYFNGAGVTRSV